MRRKSERNKPAASSSGASATTTSPEKSPAKKTTRARGRKSTAAVAAEVDPIEDVEQQQSQSQPSADDEEHATLTAATSDSDDVPVPATPSKGRKRAGAARSAVKAPSEERDEPRPSRSRRRTVQPRYTEVAEDDEEEYERQLLHQQLLLQQQAVVQEQIIAEEQAIAEGQAVVEESTVEEVVVAVAEDTVASTVQEENGVVGEILDDDVVMVDASLDVDVVPVEEVEPTITEETEKVDESAEVVEEVVEKVSVLKERSPTPEQEEKKTTRKPKSPAKKKKNRSEAEVVEIESSVETTVIDSELVAVEEVSIEKPSEKERTPSSEVIVLDSPSLTTEDDTEEVVVVEKPADEQPIEEQTITEQSTEVEVIEQQAHRVEEQPVEETKAEEQSVAKKPVHDVQLAENQTTETADEDQVEVLIEASSPATEQLLEREAADESNAPEEQPESSNVPVTIRSRRGRTRATSTNSTTSTSSAAPTVANIVEPTDESAVVIEVIPEEAADQSADIIQNYSVDDDAVAQTIAADHPAESNGKDAQTTIEDTSAVAVDGTDDSPSDPAAQSTETASATVVADDESVAKPIAKPVKPVQRKRKWLSTKTTAAVKPQILAITTDSLKDIISDVRPVPLADVKLDSSPEPEERIAAPQTTLINAAADDGADSAVIADDCAAEQPASLAPKVLIVDKMSGGGNVVGGRKVMIVTDAPVRPPSPAKFGSSQILYITNLVRPFTVQQLKTLLARTGKLCEDGFWIDKIKSKCYVKYETEDEAVETRHALHGVRWPTANPKCLNVDFGSETTMRKVIETIPSADGIRTAQAGNVREERVGGQWDRFDADEKRDKPTKRPVREWDLGKREDLLTGGRGGPDDASAHSNKTTAADADAADAAGDERRMRSPERGATGTHRRTVSKSPVRKLNKKENDPPLRLLDDLFRKTKNTPCIYWLPLTAEQISVKEEARRVQMAEHKRKQDEAAAKEKERQREREKERDRDRDRDNRDRGGRNRDRERERDRRRY